MTKKQHEAERVEHFSLGEYLAAHPEVRREAQYLMRRRLENPYTQMTHEGWDAFLNQLLNGGPK